MSHILLAQQAYASRSLLQGAVVRTAPIARDKSRERTSTPASSIGLGRPGDGSFSHILAQIAARNSADKR